MKLHTTFAVIAALFTTFMAYTFIFGDGHTYHGVLVEPAQPVSDFVLTDAQSGQPFHFEPERGQVTLLYFGYTGCPDVCPTTLGVWRQIKNKLGTNANRVRFIFITVDPERDTPEVLANYVSVFDESFIGLSDRPEAIAQVVENFGVWVEKEAVEESAIGYVVNHTASTLLVDADGALRVTYPFGTPAEDMLEDIEYLLR